MIDESDLESAAESFKELIDSIGTTCAIQRATETTDTIGAPSRAWADVATDVPCLVNDTQGRGRNDFADVEARQKAEQIVEIVLYRCQVAQSGDRIVIGRNIYEVRNLLDDESMSMVRRTTCVRYDPLKAPA